MNDVCACVEYLCGHKEFPSCEALSSRANLYCDAESFPCPCCCKDSAQSLLVSTQVFVNMQYMSVEMSALVLEVVDAYPFLERILRRAGYAQKSPSRDELTPGDAVAFESSCMVWRKEFWFDVDTNPLHVIALIDVVKDEVAWLEGYLPQAQAVHYLDFPDKS